jgi:hypothetical protein
MKEGDIVKYVADDGHIVKGLIIGIGWGLTGLKIAYINNFANRHILERLEELNP